ncbi:MAG: hypothetical protein HFF28_07970 [Oscillospiraceae bacterium]|nr:hypothetical protein [Oscillospiraceae bacterium]
MTLIQLFLEFCRVGLFSVGGGLAILIIPISGFVPCIGAENSPFQTERERL